MLIYFRDDVNCHHGKDTLETTNTKRNNQNDAQKLQTVYRHTQPKTVGLILCWRLYNTPLPVHTAVLYLGDTAVFLGTMGKNVTIETG